MKAQTPGINKTAYKLSYRPVIVHTSCWLFFIIYELCLIKYSSVKLDPPFVYLYYYAINISFFYLFVGALSFTFTTDKQHFASGVLLLITLFAGSLVIKNFSYYLFKVFHFMIMDPVKYFKTFLMSNLFRTGYFATLAMFYWAADHIAGYRKQTLEADQMRLVAMQEKSAVEIRLSETRNAYLQQQINPHMLFNSLNFIYSRVAEHSADASRCIWLLTDILRYSLEAAGEDGKTALDREIDQLYNLIEINSQRFHEPLFLELDITGDFDKYRIPPLVLFTLTENLFKHGNLFRESDPGILKITIDQPGTLYYYSRNLKKTKTKFTRITSLGIQNIRTRLNFAYPGLYTLDLLDDTDYFETVLMINL